MQFAHTQIEDVMIVLPKYFHDGRGHFVEVFRQDLFEQSVGAFNFVQDNQSLSVAAGTVRGLHFQAAPKAQGKLVRCVAGALLDVAVDIRYGSPTYGEHVAIELSADNGKQLWIPPGFAHGFCTLTDNAVISYKVTNFYSPDHDMGLLWNDQALKIKWPVSSDAAIVSDKDRLLPRLSEFGQPFTDSVSRSSAIHSSQ